MIYVDLSFKKDERITPRDYSWSIYLFMAEYGQLRLQTQASHQCCSEKFSCSISFWKTLENIPY